MIHWPKRYDKHLVLLVFSLSGMTALIYEMVWIRPLSLVFGTTVYAVSIIVASFLLGLALGSWIGGKYTDRIGNPLSYFAFVELGIGLYGILLVYVFDILPESYLFIYKSTIPNLSLFFTLQFMLAFLIILIPTTLMGATLPLVMRSYSQEIGKIGGDLGRLYSVNNIGAVMGTLSAGFILIPLLGIHTTMIATALTNIGISFFVLFLVRSLKVSHLTGIIIATIFLASFSHYNIGVLNFGMYIYARPGLEMDQIKAYSQHEKILFYKDSLYSTITVSSSNGVKVLSINGRLQCSDHPRLIDGMNKLAALPYQLFEANSGKPSNALNIGLGCGITSKALADKMTTTTVEIDPVMVEASKFFNDKIDHSLIIDDGRNWLMRNDEMFDIITTEPSDPFINWYLFTYEYFLLLNNALSENGLVSAWVPIFEMSLQDFYVFYNTFHAVFPYVYVYQMQEGDPELIFIGSKKPLEIVESRLYLFSNENVPFVQSKLNTDDLPVIEFSSATNIYRPDAGPILEKINEWKK